MTLTEWRYGSRGGACGPLRLGPQANPWEPVGA